MRQLISDFVIEIIFVQFKYAKFNTVYPRYRTLMKGSTNSAKDDKPSIATEKYTAIPII